MNHFRKKGIAPQKKVSKNRHNQIGGGPNRLILGLKGCCEVGKKKEVEHPIRTIFIKKGAPTEAPNSRKKYRK